MRKRDRVIGYPLTDPNIQVIERAGFDPDQDFPGLENRERNVFKRELFRTAVLMEGDGFHGLLEQEFSFRHHHGLPPHLDLLNRIIIREHLDRNP